jgi:hypothetical protein
MTESQKTENSDTPREKQPFHVRLPGFLIHQEMGLGDAIKRITYASGIKPCAGCERRAARMNRWLTFYPQ